MRPEKLLSYPVSDQRVGLGAFGSKAEEGGDAGAVAVEALQIGIEGLIDLGLGGLHPVQPAAIASSRLATQNCSPRTSRQTSIVD